MAETPTLVNLSNLQNETTAVNAINSNSAAIGTAFLDVLSRAGTMPNQMNSILDMNSNRIVNLPTPIGATEPLRLTDANTLNGGGTIQSIPVGGTTGQVLAKNSSISYDVSWISNQVRERLLADRTYFVRTDGNDSNTGLVNNSGGAFLTIQKAINVISQSIDLAGFNCIIQVGDGTYTGNINLAPYLGRGTEGHAGPVLIQGNAVSPSNVIIAPTSGDAVTGTEHGYFEYMFQNMRINPATGANAFLVDMGSWIVIGNGITFGSTTGNHITVEDRGLFEIVGNYTIAGGANAHILLTVGGFVIYAGATTVTLTGTPAFTASFILALRQSLLVAPSVTFSGAATGTRWQRDSSSFFLLGATPDSVFPGSVNGSITTPWSPIEGGTGFSTYAIGDLLYADTTSTLAKRADVATGSVLASGGVNTAPTWSAAPTIGTSVTTPFINLTTTGTGLQLGGVSVFKVVATNYVGLFNLDGTQIFLGGNSTDKSNFYSNDTHFFRKVDGVTGLLNINSSLAGFYIPFGYQTGVGVGGTVSQGTSRITAVTLNKLAGQITMFSAAGSATAATFTVNNSFVATTDVIHLSVQSATNLYNMLVTGIGSGTFNITFLTTGGTATDAPVINFSVIKGTTN